MNMIEVTVSDTVTSRKVQVTIPENSTVKDAVQAAEMLDVLEKNPTAKVNGEWMSLVSILKNQDSVQLRPWVRVGGG
ncbi:MAG: hypothetical protein FWH55_09005 [Oscillospiraceae bacterium]|nr:hypothetical protein [Oscillospiraceae bacterium]